MKNPFLKRVLVLLIIVVFLGSLFYFGYMLMTNSNSPYYILENISSIEEVSDRIIHTYDEYLELVNQYKIETFLKKEDFVNDYYVASFQEYDSCREKKMKFVEKVSVEENINITYRVYNKCGWCEEKIVLFLIKIDKIDADLPISYEYIYENKLECEL